MRQRPKSTRSKCRKKKSKCPSKQRLWIVENDADAGDADAAPAPVAQFVGHRAVMREVAGSNPGRINTQDLKITAAFVISSANG